MEDSFARAGFNRNLLFEISIQTHTGYGRFTNAKLFLREEVLSRGARFCPASQKNSQSGGSSDRVLGRLSLSLPRLTEFAPLRIPPIPPVTATW
jgi:hypothetical protein